MTSRRTTKISRWRKAPASILCRIWRRPRASSAASRVIKSHWKNAPNGPGVYRMIAADGEVLYVGKAKNVRKRVASYTRLAGHVNRIARMIAATADMVFISVETETDALLLEANLIKQLKPRFNVLMRDDKSFPYILIARDHDAPQITKHRGARGAQGRLFRPLRQRLGGQSRAQRVAAGLSSALLRRFLLREPHAALPALSDQALRRPLHRRNLDRRLRRAGAARPRIF